MPRRVTFAAPPSPPQPPPRRPAFAELRSTYGDVSVTLRQVARHGRCRLAAGAAAAAKAPAPDQARARRSARVAHALRAARWRPTRGPKLALPDARRLRRSYGGVGVGGASRSLYLILDVISSVGRPHSRWVYSTSDAYLAVDPAHLALLSGRAAAPEVAYERVHMVNDDCALLPPPGSRATPQALAALAEAVDDATYAQLRAVLLSGGGGGDAAAADGGGGGGGDDADASTASLRGSLVLLPSSVAPRRRAARRTRRRTRSSGRPRTWRAAAARRGRRAAAPAVADE